MLMGTLLVLQVFGYKPKYWSFYKLDNGSILKITDHQSYEP